MYKFSILYQFINDINRLRIFKHIINSNYIWMRNLFQYLNFVKHGSVLSFICYYT